MSKMMRHPMQDDEHALLAASAEELARQRRVDQDRRLWWDGVVCGACFMALAVAVAILVAERVG